MERVARWSPAVAIICCFLVPCPPSARAESYCLATDGAPYLFFATKTAYEFVYEKKLTQYIPGCKPVQMWMLGRHGTSYPNWEKLKAISDLTSLRDQIINNHESRRNGELCHSDRDALISWRPKVMLDKAQKLAHQGVQDEIYLAKRLKTNFQDILDATYTPDRFTFKFSDKEVTRSSGQAFATELFGKESPVYFTDANIDPYLSADNCTKFIEKLRSDDIDQELNKFKTDELAGSLVRSVSHRLGFLYNLTFDTILDIYDACRLEKAWDYTVTSPWCAAFTKPDLMILEYYEDLKNYYRNGYGNDLALKYGCPLVRDMMENFDKVAKNESDFPSGVFYFGESEVLEAVMARLGIANDKRPLKSTDLNLAMVTEKRQWRTAFISPFAGNIASVFYKCTHGEENKIMFFINEHTVEYEGCQVGLCSWSYIKERFARVLDPSTCNMDFCDPSLSHSSFIKSSFFLVIPVLVMSLVL